MGIASSPGPHRQLGPSWPPGTPWRLGLPKTVGGDNAGTISALECGPRELMGLPVRWGQPQYPWAPEPQGQVDRLRPEQRRGWQTGCPEHVLGGGPSIQSAAPSEVSSVLMPVAASSPG